MKNKLILASASPRRVDLLKQIDVIPALIAPADIDENPLKDEKPQDCALRLAIAKAQAVHQDGYFTLGADTLVACGRRMLPKTETEEEVRSCLALLSGRRHHVYGGIAVITPEGKIISRVCDTVVQFKRLSDADVKNYIASGQWNSVAGGYAIQGFAASYIKSIRGSHSNVVGLSLFDTMQMLQSARYF